ncbi:hypothetical protein ACVHWV_004580, partial [Escherichia coli]
MFDIVEFVKQQERFFCEALTEPTLTWAKESQFAIQQFQKNDFLAKTAQANLPSAQNAIINVAAIGITLNPSSKLAYLVPRGGAVCLDISYMGLLNRPGFPGECFICELRLPDHRFRWKHNKLFLL